jgi:hypothetical protein
VKYVNDTNWRDKIEKEKKVFETFYKLEYGEEIVTNDYKSFSGSQDDQANGDIFCYKNDTYYEIMEISYRKLQEDGYIDKKINFNKPVKCERIDDDQEMYNDCSILDQYTTIESSHQIQVIIDKEYIDKLIIEKSKKKDRALELKMELILWYFESRQNDEYCVEILLNFNTNELCRMNFSKIHIIPMKYIYNGCFSV